MHETDRWEAAEVASLLHRARTIRPVRMQRLAEKRLFANAQVYDTGYRLHVWMPGAHRTVCGHRELKPEWDEVVGQIWNAHPEMRCEDCDCLDRQTVLAGEVAFKGR